MKAINLLLIAATFGLSACAPVMPPDFGGALNGSNDTECRHAGSQGTGYVVNCNRHNDSRDGGDREIFR